MRRFIRALCGAALLCLSAATASAQTPSARVLPDQGFVVFEMAMTPAAATLNFKYRFDVLDRKDVPVQNVTCVANLAAPGASSTCKLPVTELQLPST
jgi:ABC-type sugar transport system substrate-binding protein